MALMTELKTTGPAGKFGTANRAIVSLDPDAAMVGDLHMRGLSSDSVPFELGQDGVVISQLLNGNAVVVHDRRSGTDTYIFDDGKQGTGTATATMQGIQVIETDILQGGEINCTVDVAPGITVRRLP